MYISSGGYHHHFNNLCCHPDCRQNDHHHSDRAGDRDANMMAAAAGEGQIILFPAATTSSEDLVGCYVQTTTFSSLYSDFYRSQITLRISFWDGSYITHPETTSIVRQIYSKYPLKHPQIPI